MTNSPLHPPLRSTLSHPPGDEAEHKDEKLSEWKLVFELPRKDVWHYDKWNNVEHPGLPAPEGGNIDAGTAITANLEQFKGRDIRTFNRAEISLARTAIKAKRFELERVVDALEDAYSKLGGELEFRGQQLKYLSLYLGRDVEFKIVNKGAKAPEDEPVAIRQRVLYMAEEVGVIGWAEAGFDFRNIGDFDRWVVKPRNLGIIAPEPKCVVFLKPRRSDFDYGDPLISYFMNRENRRVYVLLRNGETVYRAHIDIAVGDRLFPEEEKFERDLERHRDRNIGDLWPFGWDWKDYEKKWNARKKWYAKGFKDSDFEETIEFRTKEEMLAEKARKEAEIAERKANPKEKVAITDWDLKDVYERYNDDLKQFYFALAFIQGVLDRTDIFGHLEGKVNVFTGHGLGKYARLIYDLSESRALPDKATPTLAAWLKSEAWKVKVGDLVFVHAKKWQGNYNTGYEVEIKGVAQVVKVKAPGKVAARMERNVWYRPWDREEPEKVPGVVHRLENRESDERDDGDSVAFWPWNLPMDKFRFYIERRAERDKYWDDLLVDLMRQMRAVLKGEKPEIAKVESNHKVDMWRDTE